MLVLVPVLAFVHPAFGQEGPPRSALPVVPYWWLVPPDQEVAVIPLAWYNDVDGVVLGAGTKYEAGTTTLWAGAGLGLTGEGTHPAALEVTAQSPHGSIGYLRLHGRNAVTLRARPLRPAPGIRVSAGLGILWMDDAAYLDRLITFECPSGSSASPCAERIQPYAWSPGRDHAIELRVTRTSVDGTAELRGELISGLELAGGDHDYLKAAVELRRVGSLDGWSWRGRVGGGWTSGDAPLQRRFHLHGGDPIRRWVNPFLGARGAALFDLPYVMDDGPALRAYSDIEGLVKRYLAMGAEVGRTSDLGPELWGRFSLFLDLAWTPALPDRIGPDHMNAGGALLFDWRELPDREGEAQGRFRARALEPPSLWADAGIAFSLGYDRFALRLSLPLWASQADFANESPFDGRHRSLQTRWALTFFLYPLEGPGP